jgi:hypothetical protein
VRSVPFASRVSKTHLDDRERLDQRRRRTGYSESLLWTAEGRLVAVPRDDLAVDEKLL